MIKLFLFFSLLAASIDGFISGFLIAGMDIKTGLNDFLKITAVIFSCCFMASLCGNILAYVILDRYIHILGCILMMYLAFRAVTGNDNKFSSLWAIALSVAADAAIVCTYLSARGYNIFLLSVIASLMHSILMKTGEIIAGTVTQEKWKKKTRYLSAAIFTAMAISKIYEIAK